MSRDPDNQLTTISLRSLKSDGMDSSEALLINAAGRIIQENIQHTSYVDQRGHADNNDYMTQSGPSYSDHNESLFVMQTGLSPSALAFFKVFASFKPLKKIIINLS